MDNQTVMVALGAGWAVSEALAQIPAVRSNSVFQLIKNTLAMALKIFGGNKA